MHIAANARGGVLSAKKHSGGFSKNIKNLPKAVTLGSTAAPRRAPIILARLSLPLPPSASYRGGGDGSGGGGDGGDRGDDGSDDDSDGGSRFGGNVGTLLVVAGAALSLFGLSQKFKRGPNSKQAGTRLPAEYDTDDVRTLKRLLREVFSDLVIVRGRLDELETATGVSSATDAPAGATAIVAAASRPGRGAARARPTGLGGALGGVLRLGGGLLWAAPDEDDAGAVDEVQQAGVRLGTDLRLHLGGAVRGGADSIAAEVDVDSGSDAVSLRKVIYSCGAVPGVRLLLAPFGACGQDAAFTLNPVAGRGLAASVRHGSPLHQRVLGSMVGAAVDLRRAWLSVAYFSRALAGGGAAAMLLAQAVVAPTPAISLGLTLLEPQPDDDGLPFGLRSPAPAGPGATAAAPAGRQLGATAAVRAPGGLAVHGWATADGEAVQSGALEQAQWGLTLSPQPDGGGSGWALGAARSAAVAPAAAPGAAATGFEPNLFELSAQFDLGGGLLVTPGVVVLRQGGRNTVFAGLRSAWHF